MVGVDARGVCCRIFIVGENQGVSVAGYLFQVTTKYEYYVINKSHSHNIIVANNIGLQSVTIYSLVSNGANINQKGWVRTGVRNEVVSR